MIICECDVHVVWVVEEEGFKDESVAGVAIDGWTSSTATAIYYCCIVVVVVILPLYTTDGTIGGIIDSVQHWAH